MTQSHEGGGSARAIGELLSALRADRADRAELERELAILLADTIPQEELGRVTSLLSAEEQRRRSERYERLFNEACAAFEGGQLHEARKLAAAACALDPLRWEAHRLLAHTLARVGDTRGADLHEAMAFHLGADDAGVG